MYAIRSYYDADRHQGEAEHILPAEGKGQYRCEQHGQDGARVAGAGYAHGGALMLRRIPAGGQRQRYRKGGSGHTQSQAQQQRLVV